MDLTVVSRDIPKDEAKERYHAYRDAARATHDSEDEALMRAYREVARGRNIIDLRQTIQAGGVDEHGHPRLAVMRADVRWCWLHERDPYGAVTFAPVQRPHPRRRAGIYTFPAGTLPALEKGQHHVTGWFGSSYRAMVPVIPPDLRPRRGLRNYEILWEVDRWEKMPPPPGDPALLKHIYGWLYVVLAVWDLTPLEQAVLGARTD